MKLKLILLSSISILLLVACDNDGLDNSEKDIEETDTSSLVESGNEDTQTTEAQAEETTEESVEEIVEEIDSNLVTNGPLLEAGQYSMDEHFGRIELKKITNPGNEHEIAPGIFVTFGNIKIIDFQDIPESAQEDAEYLYGFKGNQGYDLQFEYKIENRNDFKITNTVVKKVILSDGEQIERHMFGDEAYDLEAESKVSNQVGHVAIPTEDIDSVIFYINPFNESTYDDLESKPIEVSF